MQMLAIAARTLIARFGALVAACFPEIGDDARFDQEAEDRWFDAQW